MTKKITLIYVFRMALLPHTAELLYTLGLKLHYMQDQRLLNTIVSVNFEINLFCIAFLNLSMVIYTIYVKLIKNLEGLVVSKNILIFLNNHDHCLILPLLFFLR